MEFQVEHRDGRLWASGDMTIYFAAAMKQQLLAGMQAGGTDVLLDLSQVAELDTSGLQMLLLAQRLAAAEGRRFTLTQPSAVVCEVLELCGLNDLQGNDGARLS